MKKRKSTLTPKLRQNWWVDAGLGISAVLAVLSSIYFLVYPNTGYQGGRNPYYNAVLIFSKQTWDLIHTWSGAMVTMAALLHVIIHWTWIKRTIARSWQVITKKRDGFGPRLTYNILLDVTIAISFLICSLSGVYFMLNPSSGQTGVSYLFDKTTWDLLHTWSGVIFTFTALLHIVLHWKWITNITAKMFGSKQQKKQTGQAILEPVEESI
jgi:protein-S-isoprenylcysteine O-methyltransferase Ste14